MPEGPEVRRYARQLAEALDGEKLISLTARTKDAKQWLLDHSDALVGKRIETIRSHGKHLFGIIEGGFGFHSHLMMWGRWFIHPGKQGIERDRRERARIVTKNHIAILFSAPVFQIFVGDPYQEIDHLSTLGPDILPYEGRFDQTEFFKRLLAPENRQREIGAALLDQRILAGVGNYLRAEVLFFCRIDPWRTSESLSQSEKDCLAQTIETVAARALELGGVTIPSSLETQMLADETYFYGGRITQWAARHAVFRRTNLPCLRCGEKVRQKRQITYQSDDGDATNDKSRIIYYCPKCQGIETEHGK